MLIFPRYGSYIEVVAINKLKRLLKPKIENKYLFILAPPYCGSTLLNEIISTSPFVSVNNLHGRREGQQLPTVRKIMFDNKSSYGYSPVFPPCFIKKEALFHSKPKFLTCS